MTIMGLPSKEEEVLKLFFNEPSRQWRFKDIIGKAGISRQQANKWLKRLARQNIIIHVKNKGRMPYFEANFENPDYKNSKKLFALNLLNKSGFLAHLQKLKKASTVIIFGSFTRADWHKGSDIDVFILGSAAGLDAASYWKKLGHEVEKHIFKGEKELKAIKSGLLKNILDGYLVRGSMIDLARFA